MSCTSFRELIGGLISEPFVIDFPRLADGVEVAV
jgi:hypothetical protein